MKWSILIIAGLSMLTLGERGICQDGDERAPQQSPAQADGKQPSDVWMRMKLKYSQGVYTAIARADIDGIALDAKRLNALNWFEGIAKGKDAKYQEQLRIFQMANDKLIAEAEKRNLDGCTLAFMQMTFSCTACHQRLRDEPAGRKKTPAAAP